MGRHLLVFLLFVAVAVAAGAGYYAWKSSRGRTYFQATDAIGGRIAEMPKKGAGTSDSPSGGTPARPVEKSGVNMTAKKAEPDVPHGGKGGLGPAAAPAVPNDKDELPAPVVPDPAGGRPLVKWTEVSGEIEIRRSKDGSIEQAKKTKEMFQADMATLARDAEGEIGFRLSISGRCRLSDGAKCVVRGSVNGRDCTQELEIRRGRAHFIVNRIPSGSSFSVRTPLARVYARGTEFEVSHLPADPAAPAGPWRTEVRCIEGSLVVKPFDKTKKTYYLARGGVAAYDSAGAPGAAPQPPQPKGEF